MIRGNKRTISKIQDKIDVNIHNRFDIEVIDAKTGKIKQTAYAENIILDQFWANVYWAWFEYINYGSGTGTPAASDTQLFTQISRKEASKVSLKYINKSTACSIKVITITETENVGVTFTEVGISGSSLLFTHAMLKDSNGNQISIVKTNTDIIKIYASVFVHFDNELLPNFSSSMSSSERAYSVNGFIQFLCGEASSGYPSNYFSYMALTDGNWCYLSPSSNRAVVTAFHNDGNAKEIHFGDPTPARLGSTMCNCEGGSKSVVLGGYNESYSSSYSNIAFDIPCTKFGGSTITGEALGTGDGATTNFKTKFERISDVTVYVDGVATLVTFDTGIPFLYGSLSYGYGKQKLYKPYALRPDGELYPAAICSTSALIAGTDMTNYGSGYEYGPLVYENLYRDKIQMTSLNGYGCDAYLSDDGINWEKAPLTAALTVEQGAKRYIKAISYDGYTGNINPLLTKTDDYNIHFATAPAAGAVITIDYHTDVIAKDVNHVFDYSMVVKLGEYTPS